jgi:ABC-type lipoprotein release transport system permease subunit
MKNKTTEYKKEKKHLKFTRTKEFILLLLMTCVAFFGFIIVLVYLSSLINKL